MPRPTRPFRLGAALAVAGSLAAVATPASAQTTEPSVVDPDLRVRAAVSGLTQPIGVAFLDRDKMLVIEKGTGQVKVVDGDAVTGVALDLAVNSASERGLLGIALHPRFEINRHVYLFWSESSTGADSTALADVTLLANRVDRYRWNGATLTFDRAISRMRSFQQDPNQPLRGNHNGGVIRFGPDGKLYIVTGDTGRRGQTQNLVDGPFGPGVPDDQFGGPAPDDAHLTGVIQRLNDDGSAPYDNPFFGEGRAVGGEAGANLQKVYAYGIRNSFGMAFDPKSGDLWEQENGDDSFSELNRVFPGMNSGWVQIMGPASRVAQYREIETTTTPQPGAPNGFFGLQQLRWLPTNIATTPEDALARMFHIHGSEFSDPELSWKYEVGPGGIGFLDSRRLGPQYRHDLFMGGSRDLLDGGHLFRIQLTGNRRRVAVDDPRLADRVADNLAKWEGTESESLRFGRNFGTVTDIQTGPDGRLYVVSLSKGAIYRISHRWR